jgi:hypothetical protein
MLRTYVKDELALGELLNRFRFLCRELARAKTDLGTAMRGAVRLEREIAIFQAYKKGETLTEIGRQFGLQPDHVYLIVNQQKAAFGEPITRRDGSKFPYAAEIDKRRVDEKEAEAEAERKAELDEVPTLTDEQLEILTREFAPDPVKYRTAEDF